MFFASKYVLFKVKCFHFSTLTHRKTRCTFVPEKGTHLKKERAARNTSFIISSYRSQLAQAINTSISAVSEGIEGEGKSASSRFLSRARAQGWPVARPFLSRRLFHKAAPFFRALVPSHLFLRETREPRHCSRTRLLQLYSVISARIVTPSSRLSARLRHATCDLRGSAIVNSIADRAYGKCLLCSQEIAQFFS